MTWADYLTQLLPEGLAQGIVWDLGIFIAYHIGRYVGQKERK